LPAPEWSQVSLSILNRSDETERMLVGEYDQRVFGTDLPESVVGKS
jgi:cobaltochelatase CobS